MEEKKPQKNQNFVYSYDPTNFPIWVWAIMLGLLFLIFVLGIYYSSRGISQGSSVSAKQFMVTGGILETPGYA